MNNSDNHSEDNYLDARLLSFIAASNDLVYRMSADWSRMENLVGKELLANTPQPLDEWIDKYIPAEDQPFVQEAIQMAIATKSIFELEHRVIQADNSIGWVHSRAVPLLNEQGEIIEWFGTGADITQRRIAEDATGTVIHSFKAVRDEAGNIIDFTNKKGRSILQENPAFIEAGLFNKLIHVTETGISESFDYQHNQTWYHQTHVKLGDGFLLTAVDITESKKAEVELLRLKDEIAQRATDKYYSIFNSIEEGFCIYEIIHENKQPVDLRWIEVNPAYEKQTGLKNIIGKLHSELSMNTETYWLNVYDKVALTGEPIHFENWHQPTGRWYQTFVSRISDNQVAVAFYDISTQKKAEEKQAFLLQLSDRLRPIADPAEITVTACELLGKHLATGRVGYGEVSGDGATNPANTYLTVTRDWTNGIMPSAAGVRRFSDFGEEMNAAFLRGDIFVLEDALATFDDPEVLKNYEETGELRASLAVPLLKQGKVVAGVYVQQSAARKWTDDDEHLVRTVIERIWEAVERAKAERALKASEEKYRTLFNSIDEGFCIIELLFDEQGQAVDLLYHEVNAAFINRLGTDLTGKKFSTLVPDIEIYNFWMDFYEQVVKSGQPARTENYAPMLDSWETVYASPVNGKVNTLALVFNDITERKLNERRQEFLIRLGDALRSISNPIKIKGVATDLLGEHLKTDRSHYSETFGDYIYFNEEYRSGDIQVCDDTMANPMFTNAEKEVLRSTLIGAYVAMPIIKSGEWVATLTVNSREPRKWKQHEISLVKEVAERVWIALERARAEESLRISEQQLRQSLKIREDFIGVASHELKTPVTSMRAFAEVVQERLEEAGNTAEASIIKQLIAQIVRLTSLINTLLDTTRIAEGQLKLTCGPVDLSSLIYDRIEEIKRTTRHTFSFEKKQMPPVLADAERIGQVITNLLSNAIKYSSADSTIYITLAQTYGNVRVNVKDEGCGISTEEQDRIFDRFYRVTSDNMDTFPGMGLGLYITSQIIERHNGHIWVESEPGKGSTFSFILPS
jgi:signal transduction histidine kinase/PAS domain-containing protein